MIYTDVQKLESISELVSMWGDVFGDNSTYVSSFYKKMSGEVSAYGIYSVGGDSCDSTSEDIIDKSDKKLVSACHFIPVTMRIKYENAVGTYLYAAMTRKEHERNGLMKNIITTALREAYDRCDSFMCTLPATEELYPYYEKYDFSPTFNLWIMKLTKQELRKIKLAISFDSNLSAEYSYRRSYGSQEYTIIKSKKFVEYTQFEHESRGGQYIAVYGGYIYVTEFENKAYIKECYMTQENLPYLAHTLLVRYPNCEEFIFQVKEHSYFGTTKGIIKRAGSIRIINANIILKIFAEKNRNKTIKINLLDNILNENTGLYTIEKGVVKKSDFQESLPSIDVMTLSNEIFTNKGESIPYMNMMLD